jgi:hypothetical protein
MCHFTHYADRRTRLFYCIGVFSAVLAAPAVRMARHAGLTERAGDSLHGFLLGMGLTLLFAAAHRLRRLRRGQTSGC